MRELVSMWRNTRMVVFAALTASLYAAILIPFKVLPIIPGVTELRPANAVPVVCSFLFGPAAAWGAGIGNVIGDFFGGFGPGDLFGFFGNFLYGFLPYRTWELLSARTPTPRQVREWVLFGAVVALASGACALVIGWGLNLLGFVPFRVLGNIVWINNMLASLLLAPFLLAVIYPRAERGRLTYRHVMGQREASASIVRYLGLAVVVFAVAVGMWLGNGLSAGTVTVPWVDADAATGTGQLAVGLGLLPVLGLLVLGIALL
ncbi:MAG: QueT transporter family protein [Candidatus Binatia bacterium]|nr:QueT transporter family protein [Candidatus Binatia bacterium]